MVQMCLKKLPTIMPQARLWVGQISTLLLSMILGPARQLSLRRRPVLFTMMPIITLLATAQATVRSPASSLT